MMAGRRHAVVSPLTAFALCLALTSAWAKQPRPPHATNNDNNDSDNPFLLLRAQNRQQAKAQQELQQLQQHQFQMPPRVPPSPRPRPHHPPHKPLHPVVPHQAGGGAGDGSGTDGITLKEGGGGANRNEMHKGRSKDGVGPTPWTRWTPRPRRGGNHRHWAGDHGKSGNTAECGGRKYHARDHICCQATLLPRTGMRPACCGTVAFDFVFNLCCNGSVTSRTAGKPFC